MVTNTSLSKTVSLKGALCYSLGWVSGLFFLLTEKDNQFIRFHAWQSTLFYGSLTVLVAIAQLLIYPVNWGLGILAVLVGCIFWRFLMYLASAGKAYSLPWIGKLAQRHVHFEAAISSETNNFEAQEMETYPTRHDSLTY